MAENNGCQSRNRGIVQTEVSRFFEFSLEKLDYVRNIFYNENSKLMESNFLLAPSRAEILTNLY